MPTYEYECNKCGHRFEKFQKMTDAPAKTCPKCHGPVTKLIGKGAGIVLKGSGDHGADHRRSSSESSCGRESPCCGRETPCEHKPCEG